MAYIGVNDKARSVKELYIGVNGTARKVKKAYVGDANCVARLWWGEAGTGGDEEEIIPMLARGPHSGYAGPFVGADWWDRYFESDNHSYEITEINIVDSYTETGSETLVWRGGYYVTCYRVGNKIIIAGNGSGKIRINASDSSHLFDGFYVLERITGLDLIDVSQVTNLYSTFGNCRSLTELDLSSWDTSNATDMRWMFNNCSNLKKIYVTSGKWDTSNANTDYMFFLCGTSKVTYV